jgi:hypothetical protein
VAWEDGLREFYETFRKDGCSTLSLVPDMTGLLRRQNKMPGQSTTKQRGYVRSCCDHRGLRPIACTYAPLTFTLIRSPSNSIEKVNVPENMTLHHVFDKCLALGQNKLKNARSIFTQVVLIGCVRAGITRLDKRLVHVFDLKLVTAIC